MEIGSLRRAVAANKEELRSTKEGTSSRKCKHFSKAATRWLQDNSSKYTATEVSIHLGHKVGSVRTKARSLGIKFKQSLRK